MRIYLSFRHENEAGTGVAGTAPGEAGAGGTGSGGAGPIEAEATGTGL
jgi:hypothetical protein